ncbi:hypothetical protein J1N35_028519, partial [Gossypium stocksii]
VIKNSLENEGNVNGVLALSATAINVEEDPFCNVLSVPLSRVENSDISDRGLEYLNNMGLDLALGTIQDIEGESQAEVGNDLGLKEIVSQSLSNVDNPMIKCPLNVENPILNKVASLLLGGLLTLWDGGTFSGDCGKGLMVVDGNWVHEEKEAALIMLMLPTTIRINKCYGIEKGLKEFGEFLINAAEMINVTMLLSDMENKWYCWVND